MSMHLPCLRGVLVTGVVGCFEGAGGLGAGGFGVGRLGAGGGGAATLGGGVGLANVEGHGGLSGVFCVEPWLDFQSTARPELEGP